ncbi:MAG: phosphoribosylamine--glycine ligase [Chloroflexi bacterium]|nr:phosphoribosylamine--glycine ligase [Chloroflexota bacterium]MDA1270314.1 phosphoribosylamine--glycine ligase [Chloroflexota bacterium]PKB59231.1 MAG: phosphoribosylamine--glycine ligase [SAR202 cluster bacterium Casp-Chloro-G2]
MKVLIVGSGAREHALAWRIKQSPNLTRLWVASGNAGTAALAENIEIRSSDVGALVAAAQKVAADLVVVGPEGPLALGLADRLDEVGIPVFGPSQAAAQIEASKAFALDLMRDAGVPCPDFAAVWDEASASTYISSHPGPLVVKADGLAAGKGVLICEDSQQAQAAVKLCMSDRAFGEAGDTVVLEEYLTGPEVSVFAFCDGERLSPLAAACDYKRLGDGNQGPNTGGMGSYSQPDLWTPELAAQIERTIMQPVVRAMSERGSPYKGVLYAGLMLTDAGPKVLEFNCRLGDPETQVLMPKLASDPLDLMLACAQGKLDPASVRWDTKSYVGVAMVSGGYPEEYQTGFEISGLDEADSGETMVFHAGTKLGPDGISGPPLTSGGRVLTVVGGGDSIEQARQRAYARLERISFQGANWRRDIASAANQGAANPARQGAG